MEDEAVRKTISSSFDHVGFLARSENRLRVLEAVAIDSMTRQELSEATNIPRATLGRILTDLTDRGWIEQEQARYRATPQGACLAREFHSLLETVETLIRFGELVQWFPTESVNFSIGRLHDARITTPTPSDSIAPVRRATAMLTEPDEIRGLTSVVAPDAVRASHEAVVKHGQRFEVVFTGDVIDLVLAEPDMAELFRELVSAETATGYRYDGDFSIRHNIWISDGTAAIGLSDDVGAPRAFVETEDRAVSEWVDSTIKAHRQEAVELSSADLRSD